MFYSGRERTTVRKRMKRNADEILNDLRECKRILKEKNTECLLLKQELAENKEIIEKQLNLWNIPKEIQTNFKIDELVVEYDEHADSESVCGGTCLIVKEEYTFTITIDSKQYIFSASHWTGTDWDCGFYDDMCSLEDTEEEDKWEIVMKENAREKCPVASSIISFGFYAIVEEGKEIVSCL